MSDSKIINSTIRAGIWQAELAGGDPAGVTVLYAGQPVEGFALTPIAGSDSHQISVPIPAKAISDGVQSFVVTDASGNKIGQFSIAAGKAVDEDIRTELALLRAELDILKTAFRKHCAGAQDG